MPSHKSCSCCCQYSCRGVSDGDCTRYKALMMAAACCWTIPSHEGRRGRRRRRRKTCSRCVDVRRVRRILRATSVPQRYDVIVCHVTDGVHQWKRPSGIMLTRWRQQRVVVLYSNQIINPSVEYTTRKVDNNSFNFNCFTIFQFEKPRFCPQRTSRDVCNAHYTIANIRLSLYSERSWRTAEVGRSDLCYLVSVDGTLRRHQQILCYRASTIHVKLVHWPHSITWEHC